MLRTWPISAASAASARVRRMHLQPSSADLVIAVCHGALDWLEQLGFAQNRIFLYLKCPRHDHLCDRYACIEAEGTGSDECGAYLRHIEASYDHLAEYTIFLQDDAPRHLHLGYLSLVLKLIAVGSFQTLGKDFLHLNNDRHLLYWTPCLDSQLQFNTSFVRLDLSF